MSPYNYIHYNDHDEDDDENDGDDGDDDDIYDVKHKKWIANDYLTRRSTPREIKLRRKPTNEPQPSPLRVSPR